MKKIVWDYDLNVNGVFGRNRKAKRDMFTIVKSSESKLDHAAVIELAKAKLQELKLKGNFALYEREGEIENMDGINFYTTKLVFGAKPIWNGARE